MNNKKLQFLVKSLNCPDAKMLGFSFFGIRYFQEYRDHLNVGLLNIKFAKCSDSSDDHGAAEITFSFWVLPLFINAVNQFHLFQSMNNGSRLHNSSWFVCFSVKNVFHSLLINWIDKISLHEAPTMFFGKTFSIPFRLLGIQ